MTTYNTTYEPRPWYKKFLCILGNTKYCVIKQIYQMTSTSSFCWPEGEEPSDKDWQPQSETLVLKKPLRSFIQAQLCRLQIFLYSIPLGIRWFFVFKVFGHQLQRMKDMDEEVRHLTNKIFTAETSELKETYQQQKKSVENKILKEQKEHPVFHKIRRSGIHYMGRKMNLKRKLKLLIHEY